MNRKLKQASGWLSRVSSDLLQSDYSSCSFQKSICCCWNQATIFLDAKFQCWWLCQTSPSEELRTVLGWVGEQTRGIRAEQHLCTPRACCAAACLLQSLLLQCWELTDGQWISPLCPLNERGIFHAVLSTVFYCAAVPLSNALCVPLPVMPNAVIPVFFS